MARPLNELHDMDFGMKESFVGPMPVKIFLDEFLPVQLPAAQREQLPGFGVMTGIGLESQMCAFVRSLFVTLLDPCF